MQGLGLKDVPPAGHALRAEVRRGIIFDGVVVSRRGESVREWRNWLREDPLVHPYKWLRPDLVPPAPFLQCDPLVTPGGSVAGQD